MEKTPGQIAYEAELKDFPCYEDGTPRRAWDKLPAYAKLSWEREPTPRKLKKRAEK